MLSDAERERIGHELSLLARESGVSFHVRSERIARESPVEASGRDSLGEVAGGADPRSVLLAVDPTAASARIDLGYAIEPLVPDALAGLWLDETVVPLLARRDPGAALELAIRMFADRVRHERLAGAELARPLPWTRHAGGGGGARSLSLPVAPQHRPRAPRRPPARSVDSAYERYLAWLAAGDPTWIPDVLTPASRDLLVDWPLTTGYLEYVYQRESGRSYEVLERDGRALLFFVDDPLPAPHFFVEDGTDGWRICLATEASEVLNLAGGDDAWSLRHGDRAVLRPFAEELIDVGAARRIRGGDHRSIRGAVRRTR